MILKGSQRGGGKQLAVHLLNAEDNEHVHEMRGFVAEDLPSAFHEAYAVSRGTRAKQFLFSLSLNPPGQANVSTKAFEKAIDTIEQRLGLGDQPRAIVFHEEDGRRHAHAVWSRIDADEMTAINLPYYKLRLRDVSKELYREHGWPMPRGLIDAQERDPANFSHAEWQQPSGRATTPKPSRRCSRTAGRPPILAKPSALPLPPAATPWRRATGAAMSPSAERQLGHVAEGHFQQDSLVFA